MQTPGERLRGEIARMSDAALDANQPKWLVSLYEPTDVLYATTADHSDTNLLAVLYSDRMEYGTFGTDRQGVLCIRTKTPVCVLGASEQFMPLLMSTLRANGCHGTYRQAGTKRKYGF